jgi:lysozyme family protein
MSDPVEEALEEILRKEGGYVDHPADRGGPTNFGITEAVARAFGFDGDMADISEETARQIYRNRYWHEPLFDLVAQRSKRIAFELFDTGVNMGPATAARFLQRSLNVLNRAGKTYPDMAADGRIGPITLSALDAFLAARGATLGEAVLLKTLNGLQLARFVAIAEKDPTQEAFVFGWVHHRVDMDFPELAEEG